MITLNANIFLGALTNLIAYSQVANTTEAGIVGEFVNSFQDINVENGDGKVVLSSDLLTVNNYSGTSSVLTNTLPTVDEQYISVENYKVIPLTINNYLMRGAFVEETQLASFVAYLMSTMRATMTAYLSDALIAELEAYTPTQADQTQTINIFDTTGLLDPMQLRNAKTYNDNAIQEKLITLIHSMGFATNKYNDKAFREIIDFSSMKFIVKNSTNGSMLVNSLATLLNSGKITDAEKWSKTYVIPDEQFSASFDQSIVGWLMHNKKIQFGFFYEVATSFFDPSTLDTRNWLHFAYYLDTVDALPAVMIKVDATLTPTALT